MNETKGANYNFFIIFYEKEEAKPRDLFKRYYISSENIIRENKEKFLNNKNYVLTHAFSFPSYLVYSIIIIMLNRYKILFCILSHRLGMFVFVCR